MKTIQYIILSLLLISAGKLSAQQITNAELQVTGLTCSMCSQATEKSLKTLGFVESIKPDLNKNIFVIDFKKGQPVNLDLLRKKVQDAGFSIGNLSTTINFNNVKVDESGQAKAGQQVYKVLNAKGKTLNGPVKATIVDKNFISSSAFKQKSNQFKSETYASGYGMIDGKRTRIYHITI